MRLLPLREPLETLYSQFNTSVCIHPDPLEFVGKYINAQDREIVALIASCLAYGRVRTILKSVSAILDPLGASPASFIISHTCKNFKEIYENFVHRFTKGSEIAEFLEAIRQILLTHGSLKTCFLTHYQPDTPTVVPALRGFVHDLRHAAGRPPQSLLPNPEKGSAMKRLHLFLRWMIRCDQVDPGDWREISPAKLLYPLDTHIHAFGLRFGLTRRKNANLKTTLEITEAFRTLSPEDPVKYDFALARVGILRLENPI